MDKIEEFYEEDEVVIKADNTRLLDRLSIVFAEYIGTTLLVFLTCMGCTLGMSPGASSLQVSLMSGLAVMTAIQMFGHISGAHVNPAVTLCAVIMDQVSLPQAAIYIGSQLAGSITGYALLMVVTPDQHLQVPNGHCVTLPNGQVSDMQAVLVEIIATIVLCGSICAAWDSRNKKNSDSVALRIGLVVAMLAMTAGPYTGASMNPARSIGPAIWNNQLGSQWIYWMGPVMGATIAGFFYKLVLIKTKLYY